MSEGAQVSDYDTPTSRATITDLPELLALQHLEQLRERRMRARATYEETLRAKKEARADTVSKMLVKQLDMCAKELARAEKAMDQVSDRINKIRALRLELEG